MTSCAEGFRVAADRHLVERLASLPPTPSEAETELFRLLPSAVAAVEGRDVAEVRSLRAGAHVDDDGRVAARELQDVLQRAQRVAAALVDEGADEDLRVAVVEQHREQAAAQPERPRASRAHHSDSCLRCSSIAAPATHA